MPLETPPLTATAEIVQAYVLTDLLRQTDVEHYLQRYSSTFNYEQLRELFTGKLFNTYFSDYWKYESSSVWKGRSFSFALRETILHSLSALSGEAQLRWQLSDPNHLAGYSVEEAKRLDALASTLTGYFHQRLELQAQE